MRHPGAPPQQSSSAGYCLQETFGANLVAKNANFGL
jgi:hypothetical protein